MKKSIAALLLAAATALTLTGCGGRNADPVAGDAREDVSEIPSIRSHGASALPDLSEEEETHEELPEDPPEKLPEEVPVSPPAEQKTADYIRIETDGLNIRTGAGTGYPVLAQAQKNTLLCLDGREGNFYRTRYLGKTAYVSANASYTSVFTMKRGGESTENVISVGLSLLGTPYVYGAVRLHDGTGHFLKGFSADRFDCSSLMQYIFYYGAGIHLNLTTRTQIAQGEEVSSGALRRGDLMFFTNASRKNKQGVERVGHVALYLGNNYILHTASDFAKIEEISPARWDNFIAARRLLPL